MSENSNVIRFPTQLRVVPLPPDEAKPDPGEEAAQLVDHDGDLYRLSDLMIQLPAEPRSELEAEVPRSGQETWDLVSRRWPTLAARSVASVRAVLRPPR